MHHPEIIILLRLYENQFNQKEVEFPVSIKKTDNFGKNIAVNVLFNNKKNQKKNTYIQSV